MWIQVPEIVESAASSSFTFPERCPYLLACVCLREMALERGSVIGNLTSDGGGRFSDEFAVQLPLHHTVDCQRDEHAGSNRDELKDELLECGDVLGEEEERPAGRGVAGKGLGRSGRGSVHGSRQSTAKTSRFYALSEGA